MKNPADWESLVQDESVIAVSASRAFRHSPGFFQFTDGTGGEHIAVRSQNPYGAYTSLPPAAGAKLLDQERRGADYALFRVPVDMLSLEQASLSVGNDSAPMLKTPYRRLGQVVGQLARVVPAPLLGVEDFGIERESGTLVLLPPLELGDMTSDRDAQLASVTRSIAALLDSRLRPDVSTALISEVTSGFRE